MKTLQSNKRNTSTSKMQSQETGTSQAVMERSVPEESCGVRQAKDGVTFTAFYPEAVTVQIAGDFNNWQPEKTPMKKSGKEGLWKVKLPLKAGTHCYRYVVDGHWHQDPCNDAAEPNSFGEFNSVVHV